ncbi:MAG: transcriptional regulator, TetR family [Hydrocarboniphaga sp.]|uniref:TetR/AcrR family transcriptional regulator n=1 Tax=Hydrocarboniphaga sp. TaxID=2033016 RepID=UPI0026328983|nr:TetR/AcrR family transcriptional regulator [Hydrocarboniphaga sp.]MDB5970072.1 transcriptional regulator, TetR family [Hydrocarboniphaga sp.]
MPRPTSNKRSPESRIGSRRRAAAAGAAENYEARRAEIVAAAAQVFQRVGYDKTTLLDVAEQLGTDRASLYYYVAGKEDLLRVVVLGVVMENLAVTARIAAEDAPAPQKLERFVLQLMRSYAENYPHMYSFIQNDLNNVGKTETDLARQLNQASLDCETQFLTILEQGVAEGVFRDDIPLTMVANGAFGMLNWTHRWFKPGKRHTAEDVARYFSLLLLRGVGQAAPAVPKAARRKVVPGRPG